MRNGKITNSPFIPFKHYSDFVLNPQVVKVARSSHLNHLCCGFQRWRVRRTWRLRTSTHKAENRHKFKQVMGKVLLSEAVTKMIPLGKSLTVNGLYNNGVTWVLTNESGTVVKTEGITLEHSEADVKMYQLCDEEIPQRTLVVSLDTDTIFIGLLRQVKEVDDSSSFFVEFGRTDKKYVDLRVLVKQICHVYPLPNPLEAILGFVRLYAVTGGDFNPFFKYLSKPTLFKVNEETNQATVMGIG